MNVIVNWGLNYFMTQDATGNPSPYCINIHNKISSLFTLSLVKLADMSTLTCGM